MNRYKAFRQDIAGLLHTSEDAEIVDELAQIAGHGAKQNKEVRIVSFLAYIKQNHMETITIADRTYDTLELLIALAHLNRSMK